MIRFIIKQCDEGAAMHVGGPVHESFITVDAELPDVEAILRGSPQYVRRNVIGVELLAPSPAQGGSTGGEG